MSDTNPSQLHKEFELERMILFSDAVFAIAITLLVIEIHFPEIHDPAHADLKAAFMPVLREGLGFLVSFVFIGVSWVTHLKLFRFLRSYDNGIIFRNLITLFFIVTFPFTASGLTHYRPGFTLPMLIYFGNVMLVFVSNFALAHYMFRQRAGLTMPGNDKAKAFLYKRSRALAIAFPAAFSVVLFTAVLTHHNEVAVTQSFYVAIAIMAGTGAWIRKTKPKNLNV